MVFNIFFRCRLSKYLVPECTVYTAVAACSQVPRPHPAVGKVSFGHAEGLI